MLNLSANTNCDTFKEYVSVMPLLAAYEFIHIARKEYSEYEALEVFAREKNWVIDLNKMRRFLQNRKNTIVITCEQEKIEWVSKGFSRMTGYDYEEAVGKSPKFLQGKETSPETRSIIREKLSNHEKFSGEVTNYRKNNERYVCKVDILPIFNQENKLVNFVAFEHEVEA